MKSQTFGLLLTAREGISHHDPTTGNDSNILTFNRQRQFVYREPTDTPVFLPLVEAIAGQNPMPETIAGLTSRLSAPEWLAVAYIRLLLDIHNRGEGEGLLSGMERYRMLENRLQTAAVRVHTLHRLWSVLTDDLQLETHPAKYDALIASFWTLPPSVQYQMLTVMAEQYRAITTLARVWHTANKEQSLDYMERAGRVDEFEEQGWVTASFNGEHFPEPPDHIVLDVPAISVNSLRHQLVREPSWLHLCDALGFEPAARGEGELPVHADAIFYNGGNIKAGASQPSNAFFLAGEIRKAYPSLDLLGGVTSSFDLGESKLKVSAWIVCTENRDALPEALRDTAQAQTSVFDMLDNVTRTRQASPDGEGQMIYNYETLVKGTQVYVELTLTPYTGDLARGALAAAIDYYLAHDNVIGGQSARGHGHVLGEWLTEKPVGREEYEAFLAENRQDLRQGIVDGTLLSSKVVVK
jgi:hypothetical protein